MLLLHALTFIHHHCRCLFAKFASVASYNTDNSSVFIYLHTSSHGVDYWNTGGGHCTILVRCESCYSYCTAEFCCGISGVLHALCACMCIRRTKEGMQGYLDNLLDCVCTWQSLGHQRLAVNQHTHCMHTHGSIVTCCIGVT